MSITIETVRREALTLPLPERVALVEDLLSSLDQPDPSIDALWLEESERRFAAYKAGRMKAIDAQDVFRQLGQS